MHSAFPKLQLYQQQSHRALVESENNLHLFEGLQVGALFVGLILQVVAAAVLNGFFTQQFMSRVETLRINVDRISKDLPFDPALSGTDEIAELDQSFRKMSQELALKAAREQALFENASDVICVLDQDMKIERMNAACTRMWGYIPEDLESKPVMALLPMDSGANVQTILSTSKAREPAASFEADVLTKSGPTMRCSWSTFWSEQNRRWFCVIHDIAEQHRLEKRKQSFLSMIARDLEAP
jgi:PAS domain S-box-containing protein